MRRKYSTTQEYFSVPTVRFICMRGIINIGTFLQHVIIIILGDSCSGGGGDDDGGHSPLEKAWGYLSSLYEK